MLESTRILKTAILVLRYRTFHLIRGQIAHSSLIIKGIISQLNKAR